MKQIKKRFGAEMRVSRFCNPELVAEILDTKTTGPVSDALKAGVVDRLRDEGEKGESPERPISFTAMLLDAIRAMAAVSRYLDEGHHETR
jgi:hypothetical protein